MPTPRTAEEVWEDLVALVEDRAEEIELLQSYYLGEQDLPVDAAEFRTRFGAFFANFRANLARPIIETAEGRVRIRQWGDGKGLAADAQKIWRRNRMGMDSRLIHTQALVKGDSYVIVLPRSSDSKAGIWPQLTESIAILYDDLDPRAKLAAIKWWIQKSYPDGKPNPVSHCRINLYFPDRIERYVSVDQTDALITDRTRYRRYTAEGAWKTRHALGEVPVFQFSANFDLGRGHGRSDLADAMPLIDAVNKSFLDLFVASEFTAAPQRWATGVEIPLDPKTGEPQQAYKAGADKLWTAPNEDARFGQFAPGELAAYSDAINLLVEELAHITRTPVDALLRGGGEIPADEALKTAEGPLRARVQDHQDAFGEAWLDVMAAAMNLDGIAITEDDREDIEPAWLPPNAPYSTREWLEEVKIKAEVAGVPEQRLWEELGYSAQQIEAMKAMREEEANLGQTAWANASANTLLEAVPEEEAEVPGGLSNDILGATGAPQ